MTSFAFLFGSGISLHAGLPTTKAITDAVLTGQRANTSKQVVEHVRHHSDGRFEFTDQPDDSPSLSGPLLQLIHRLLGKIKDEIDVYYEASNSTTYEAIYFVLFQLESTATRELDNPAVDSLTRDLRRQFPETSFSSWTVVGTFDALLTKACDYVKDVVRAMLMSPGADASYLRWIVESCRDADCRAAFIFTLNHDTLLERHLNSSGIEFIDGFALPRCGDGLRLWNSSLFDAPSSNVRVVKLHGSVDWFREIPNRREHNPIPFKFGDSRPSEKLDIDRPLILIGTHNKPAEYTNKVYEDLHVQFYLALKGIHRLVICGYGFNDKGINTRLIHWMSRSADHRIVLIHKNPEDCVLNARGAIQREWHYWGAERARPERAWAEDVAWPDLRRSIA